MEVAKDLSCHIVMYIRMKCIIKNKKKNVGLGLGGGS